MWLTFLFFVVAVLVLAGGILIGGPVALVLVPLAVIVFIVVLGYGAWSRATGLSASLPQSGAGDALPHSGHQNTAPRPATPDDLVDARQQQ